MERTLLLSGGGGEIRVIRLPEEAPSAAPPAQAVPTRDGVSIDDIDSGGIPALIDKVERQLIIDALEREGGVQARAARRLGVRGGCARATSSFCAYSSGVEHNADAKGHSPARKNAKLA